MTATITEHQEHLVNTLAEKIVKYRMTVPAILFLESVRPLNFIGSQAMLMFHPFLNVFFSATDIEEFSRFLEKRENMEILMEAIERKNDERRSKQKIEKESE